MEDEEIVSSSIDQTLLAEDILEGLFGEYEGGAEWDGFCCGDSSGESSEE